MAGASSPSWKLYQNPHFSSDSLHRSNHLLLPFERAEISPPPVAVPVNDLTLAREKIGDLRAELELERRMRRDAESLAKSLSLELVEERRLRAEAEAEAARCRDAAGRAVRETEEERRMLKFADSWREERVQMKLAEAAIVLEEKMMEIAEIGVPRSGENDCKGRQGKDNPHIKRGVKGFVEFSRAAGKVRSPGSVREKERVVGNLECQKSQFRVLLRQRNTVDLGVVADAQSLVVQ